MKRSWKTYPLSEIAISVKRGRAPVYTEQPSAMSVLNQRCIRDGKVDWSKARLTDYRSKMPPEASTVIVGDILINSTGRGTLGRTGLVTTVPRPTTVDSHVAVVRPNKSVVLPAFLAYQLRSLEEAFIGGATGSTQQTELPVSFIASRTVVLPPLDEQQRIVEKLDRLESEISSSHDVIRERRDQASRLRKAFTKNRLEAKSGWETKTLTDLAKNLDKKRKPITKAKRVAGSIPYYGASGVVDHVADWLFDFDTLLISEDGANLLARSSPIAFAARGKYWVNNHAHVLQFESPITQRFVEHYLNAMKLDFYVTGAAQPKLNQTSLNKIPIVIPATIAEQASIVSEIDGACEGADQLAEVCAKIASSLESLWSSSLSRFTRPLVVLDGS